MQKVTVTGGQARAIVFDRRERIRRRYDWAGEVKLEPKPDDPVFDVGDDEAGYPWTPPEGNLLDDVDVHGDGPIELTPFGPRQPARPKTPPPEPEGDESPLDDPLSLDFWSYLPPPPFSPWRPDTDLTPDEEPDDGPTFGDPCDPFHPLGPFGPFVEPLNDVEPRLPWVGPHQSAAEAALLEAIGAFLKELQPSVGDTVPGRDLEAAGRRAAQRFAEELWKWFADRLEDRFFGGDLSFESTCEFVERRPWLTGVTVFLGLSGYGLYLGREYDRKGELEIDLGPVEFEYDGETGEWAIGVRYRIRW